MLFTKNNTLLRREWHMMWKFCGLRAQIQLGLALSFPSKATLRRSLCLELDATLEAMTKEKKKKKRRRGSRLVLSPKSAKVWDQRSRSTPHPLAFFFFFLFFLTERIEHRLPRPCLQTQYLATAGALEVMSTNRCSAKSVSIAQLFQACLSIFSSGDVLVRTQTL